MGFSWYDFKRTGALFIPRVISKAASRKCCIVTFILIVVDIAAVSLVPFLSKRVVDLLSLDFTTSIYMTVMLLGFFWTLEKTLSYLQDILFFPVINTTIQEIYHDVVQHIHQIPLSRYQTLSIPEILSAIKRIGLSARSFIKITFLMIIPTLIKLIIASIVVLKLGAFGAGLLVASFIALIVFYKGACWYARSREETWQATDTVTMRMNDSILNTKISRFHPEFEMAELDRLLKTEARLWHQTNTRQQLIHITMGALFGITLTMILYKAVLSIQAHQLTLGDFVLIKGQLIAAFLPLKNISLEFRQLTESLVDIKKIIDIFDIPSDKSNVCILTDTHSVLSKGIQVKNISFAYDAFPLLLKNISFQVKEGEKIAITGNSGCGKSSLAGLMTALYKPATGKIWIHGQEVTQLSKTDLGRMIHLIPQDCRLFNESLRYNLTYGANDILDSALQAVIQQTGLRDLIARIPAGLNTRVGEMGTRLSGGEKQRVLLARALLLKPSILILDETTHSLTSAAEKRILTEIFKVIPTVILISHRASTLTHVDRILSLRKNGLFELDKIVHLRDHQISHSLESEPI